MPKHKIAIFEGKRIRRHWDGQKELWYFSIIDVVEVLTGSSNPQVYWRVLKKRLIDEGSDETVTKCNGLKMKAIDGKMRVTDVADTEVMLRIIQSIPSPKAEPFKLWLARVGYERLEETADPELAINRALKTYLELVLNMLAETATTKISQKRQPKNFPENKKVAREGGSVAGNARKEIEFKTGKKVIARKNARKLKFISNS